MLRRIRRVVAWIATLAGLALVAFVIDAERDHDDFFRDRLGTQVVADVQQANDASSTALSIRLTSDTGLAVRIRVIRPNDAAARHLRTLILIGGHRTGSRAVELAGAPACCAVVALDYPFEGELETGTLLETLGSVPMVRRAVLDIPPAISLTVSWLEEQDWVDTDRIELAGVSLGVPFATTAAAMDERIRKLWIVHGAADNYLWLRHNVARRGTARPLQPAYARLAYWLLYAGSFNTAERIQSIAPRPVTIIGAREDERTPPGQTESLYASAEEPKELLWTDGNHIEPSRSEVILELLALMGVE